VRGGGGPIGVAPGGGGPIGVVRGGGFSPGGVAVARGPVVVHRAFFPHHRAFFPRHRVFARPFIGYGFYAGYSCWRWVPTPFCRRQIWVCDYPYGFYY